MKQRESTHPIFSVDPKRMTNNTPLLLNKMGQLIDLQSSKTNIEEIESVVDFTIAVFRRFGKQIKSEDNSNAMEGFCEILRRGWNSDLIELKVAAVHIALAIEEMGSTYLATSQNIRTELFNELPIDVTDSLLSMVNQRVELDFDHDFHINAILDRSKTDIDFFRMISKWISETRQYEVLARFLSTKDMKGLSQYLDILSPTPNPGELLLSLLVISREGIEDNNYQLVESAFNVFNHFNVHQPIELPEHQLTEQIVALLTHDEYEWRELGARIYNESELITIDIQNSVARTILSLFFDSIDIDVLELDSNIGLPGELIEEVYKQHNVIAVKKVIDSKDFALANLFLKNINRRAGLLLLRSIATSINERINPPTDEPAVDYIELLDSLTKFLEPNNYDSRTNAYIELCLSLLRINRNPQVQLCGARLACGLLELHYGLPQKIRDRVKELLDQPNLNPSVRNTLAPISRTRKRRKKR